VEFFHDVLDPSEEGVIEVSFDGLPTAVAAIDSLLGQPLNAGTSGATGFFALAMNAEADLADSGGANIFEVAFDVDQVFDPDAPAARARPRSRVPSSPGSGDAARGIEALEGFFGDDAFIAAQPNDPGDERNQPCELVLYDDGDGVSFQATAAFGGASTAARYDGVFPNPLAGLRGSGLGSRAIAGTANQIGAPGTPSILTAVAAGVRSAKAGIGVAGLFLASPAVAQLESGTAPQQSVECDLGAEDPLLTAPGFLATNPEVLALLGLPVQGPDDISAEITLTQLDANRVAIRFSIVDADGEPIALLSAPGLLVPSPLALQLSLLLDAAVSGTVTITDAFGEAIEGEVTEQEDGSVLIEFADLPALFAGGVADQSCENASGQLILTFEGGLEAFDLSALEGTTSISATVSFAPGGGGVVKIAGGCAVDPGAGLAGLLGLGPLGMATALLVARGARAGSGRSRARRDAP